MIGLVPRRIEKVGNGKIYLNDGRVFECHSDHRGTYVQVGAIFFYPQPGMLVALPEDQAPRHD